MENDMPTTARMRHRTIGGIALMCLLATAVFVMGASPANATFPGKNGRIFYVGWEEDPVDGPGYNIFGVDPESGEVTRITDLPGGDIWGPRISPDGRRIVFSYNRWERTPQELQPWTGGRYSGLDLYVMDIDGSNLVRTTDTRRNEWMPTWSPDGDHIAFVRKDKTQTQQIFVMRSDGSGRPRQLTFGKGTTRWPDWSPDGKRIAFSATTSQGNSELFTIRPNGRGLKRITQGAWVYYPSWSPDGRKIAWDDWRYVYEAQDPGCGVTHLYQTNRCDSEIFVIRADGQRERQLTDEYGADMLPTWSPDGTKITFVSDRLNLPWHTDVFVMNADGSDQKLVLQTPVDEWVTAWERR